MRLERMQEPERIPDDMDFLTSSKNRFRVLRALVDGPWDPSELRKGLDVPRSTFRRILSELEDRQWAENTQAGYRATPLGEYVVDVFSESVEKMDRVNKLSGFFEEVSFSEVSVDFDTVAESSVTVQEQYAPHAPMEHLLSSLEDTDEVRGFAPVITDAYADAYYQAIKENGTEVEHILSESVARIIRRRYPEQMKDTMDTDRTETYVYSDEFPLGLTMFDDSVLLYSLDENGVMKAILENDDEELYDWAQDYYEGYLEKAEPFEKYF